MIESDFVSGHMVDRDEVMIGQLLKFTWVGVLVEVFGGL